MEPENIKEFRALVERYETITFEEIKEQPNPSKLTGFGSPITCTLCIAIGRNCDKCVYGPRQDYLYHPCNSGKNEKSFGRIENADTPIKIKNAYRARAKHLRKTYPQYLK